MLIGIDASRASRKFKTGVEWYSYHLIQEFKKIPTPAGDKFILYSSDKLRGDLENLPDGWQSRILFWPLKYLWTQIRLSWEMLVNPPNILFVPAHCLPIISRARAVLTIHDLGFKRFSQAYSLWQRIYYSFVHWFAVKRADKIIVPSEFTKKELIEIYKAEDNKIVVIPLGYDSRNYRIIKDREKDKLKEVLAKYKIGKSYFLYVGRLERKKNIKGLIEAYQSLITNYQLSVIPQMVLVGNPGYGYSEVRTKIINDKNIITIGYIKPRELTYLYNGARAFVFPSLYEGFGIPLLEAMASGCPVITAKTASIPEVANQAALYFKPADFPEMAEMMKKIIDDESLRSELIEAGRTRVKEFSWQKCAQKTKETLLDG